jgi:hypothetical protein
MAALFIHRGSGESKDSDDRIEARIDKIQEQVEKLASRGT